MKLKELKKMMWEELTEPEWQTELNYYFNEMEYEADYTLQELEDQIGTRFTQPYHPQSSEARQLREFMIEHNFYKEKPETMVTMGTGKGYAFKHDSVKYVYSRTTFEDTERTL